MFSLFSNSRKRQQSITRKRKHLFQTLERRAMLAGDLLFADSFEQGSSASDWVGNWTNDNQNDWFRSTRRATDGIRSAEVDGSANNAALTLANAIDLTGYSSAELSYSWYIQSNWDSGEYIALDVYDGGWQQVDIVRGNVDAENVWHHRTINLDNYLNDDFKIRFRSKVSASNEDGNVDNVRITAVNSQPTISITDSQVTEGNAALFTVSLSSPSTQPVSVGYTTANGTALATSDFVSSTNTLFFAPGEMTKTISVATVNDATIEPTETFRVELLNPSGAILDAASSIGIGAITDDDAPTVISYLDFGNQTGLDLLGDASVTSNGVLRLTPAAVGMEGAAWFTGTKPIVSVDWETTFDFNLNENVGDFGGSDGFAFVIQNHSPAFLGGGGAGLGYSLLPNSVVIEFDTFQNINASDPAASDPSQSHISIHTAGTDGNQSSHTFSLASYDTPELMDDAQTHQVRIAYVGGVLSVYYDDPAAPVLAVPVNLDDLLDLDGGRAWVGFTAATGGGYQNHDILNWEFRSLANTNTTVAVAGASVLEGDTGTVPLVFTVTRAGDTSGTGTVEWLISDGTATAGVDYAAASGQLEFAAGETEKTIAVTVFGDVVEEDTEGLLLTLSSPVNLVIIGDSAIGTILNDDTSISVGDAIATEGDTTLTYLGHFISEGSGGLFLPRDSALGPDLNADGVEDLYVISARSNEILAYDGVTGDFIRPFVSGVPQLDNPGDLAFSPTDGHLYVTSSFDTTRIFRFDGQTGAFLDAPVLGTVRPLGFTFVENGPNVGDLLIADRGTNEILRFDGSTVTTFVTAGLGGLSAPRNVAIGPDGNLYVSSNGSNEVLKYDGVTGGFLSVVAANVLSSTSWVVFGEDGFLYLSGSTSASSDTNSLAKIDPTTGSVEQIIALPRGGWSFSINDQGVVYSSGNASGDIVDLIGPASVAAFEITLTRPMGVPVTLDFATLSGTAGLNDYLPISGSITFEPGVVSRTIIVPTVDDSEVESVEEFSLLISNASIGSLVKGVGVGTIINDDLPPPNQSPLANDDFFTVAEDLELSVAAPGVLVDDTDPENDALTASLVTTPNNGTLNLNADGSFTYTPEADFYGFDTFTYRANDGGSDSNLATVTVEVTPVNDAPVAIADSFAVAHGTTLNVSGNGVLANDVDVDGDTLSAVAWTGSSAQGGQVVLNSNGSFTYTPPSGFSGTDTFSYQASDGSLISDLATVSIEVEAPSNDNAMYVYDIRFESRYWGWQRRAVFEIRWDSNGDGQGGSADARLAGVSITVEFAGRTYTGTTDSNGIFRTSWLSNPGSGAYAEVVDMALAEYAWNPLALDLEDDSDGDGRPDAQL